MNKTRLVLLSNRSYAVSGIGRYLEASGAVDITQVALDDPRWADRVRNAAPDVVLTDATNSPTASSVIGSILGDLPDCDVIALRFDLPDVVVYHAQRVALSDVQGLIDLLQRVHRRRGKGQGEVEGGKDGA